MTAAAPTAHEETVHGGGHAHPSDRNYIGIAGILAGITAVEVAMSYADISRSIFIPALIIMMIAKFAIVAAWFMHLRFDSRMFRMLFVAGIFLAVAVYMAFLTAMQMWGKDTTDDPQVGVGPAVTQVSPVS